MNNTILYIAVTIGSLFLVMHLVARIQMARAVLVSPADRKKGNAIANRGVLQGALCVALFAAMLSRGVGGALLIIPVVLSLWLAFGCYRMTRMLILMQSVMQLRKRTAKGGGMNSGALAGIVSCAAGLTALVWAFIANQPQPERGWEEFKNAHRCQVIDRYGEPSNETKLVNAQGASVGAASTTPEKSAWLCDDGVIHHR